MTENYSDSLRGLAGSLYNSGPSQRLRDFLEPFEMMPDVRSQITTEFWEREGLYEAIMNNISAYNRVKDNINYGLENQGNIAVEIRGRKRHGKSTVGRWLAQTRWKLRTGSVDGWEDKVIYDQSYSGATNKIQELARTHWEQVCEEFEDPDERLKAFFGSLRYFLSKQDENLIEHHEDSVRAQNDLKNLVRTCAVTQIDFFFISTVPRIKEVDFALWVVGIDKKRKVNLSFYYDSDGHCHGYLITPNVDETSKYQHSKMEAVRDVLLLGGRRPAKRKILDEEQEAEIQVIVPPDADFMTTLEAYARVHLEPLVKKSSIIDRWVLRYFKGLTHKAIAGELNITRSDTVGDSLRSLDDKISNTTKGNILEDALCHYLNLARPGLEGETQPSKATSSTESRVWRRDLRGCDVAYTDSAAPDPAQPLRVAVNCKLLFEHRPSWQLKCLPEAHRAAQAYLLLVTLSPPQPTIQIYPCHDPQTGLVDTGSVEELPWEAWLDELQSLTMQEVIHDATEDDTR